LKRTHDMFLSDQGSLPPEDDETLKLIQAVKAKDQYGPVISVVENQKRQMASQGIDPNSAAAAEITAAEPSNQLALITPGSKSLATLGGAGINDNPKTSTSLMAHRKMSHMPKPKWHPPWKLHRVISGHLG